MVKSPKSHKLVIVPELIVELLVNTKLFPPRHCDVSEMEKADTGIILTYAFLVMLSVQPRSLVVFSLTLNVPVAR